MLNNLFNILIRKKNEIKKSENRKCALYNGKYDNANYNDDNPKIKNSQYIGLSLMYSILQLNKIRNVILYIYI